MRPLHRTGALVRRPVVIGDVCLGVAADVLLDGPLTRLVGFEVACGDGTHRFLPLPACEVRDDHLAVTSALVLLDRELGFYRAAGSALSELVGEDVNMAGGRIGELADLLVDEEGKVARVAVSVAGGEVELEAGTGLEIGDHLLRPAV